MGTIVPYSYIFIQFCGYLPIHKTQQIGIYTHHGYFLRVPIGSGPNVISREDNKLGHYVGYGPAQAHLLYTQV